MSLARIAFLNQPFDAVLPPHQNSIGIWSYEVARRAAARADVVLYAKHMRVTQSSATHDEGFELRLLRARPNSLSAPLATLLRPFFRPTRPLFASRLDFAEYAIQAAIDARRRRCDVVHIHNFSNFVPIVRFFHPHATIVLHMNCEWLSLLDRTMLAARLRQVDLVLGSSDWISGQIRERFPDVRCRTVYNGVDVERFDGRRGADPSNPRIVWVGRLSPEKGVHVLLEAFERVAESVPSAQLVLVGGEGVLDRAFHLDVTKDPVLRAASELWQTDYARRLRCSVPAHLRSRVHFAGPRSPIAVAAEYRRADVVVQPSLLESFGMVAAEAMAMRVPVVATDFGPVPEVVDRGRTGLLVERGDAAGLARAIVDLLGDRERAAEMGRLGRLRVLERFTWERVVESLWEAYDSVSTSRGGPPH